MGFPLKSRANQVVEFTDFSTLEVEVAKDSATTFVLPDEVVNVVVPDRTWDIKSNGRYVFVTAGKGDGSMQIVVKAGGLFSFYLKRVDHPGGTVVVEDKRPRPPVEPKEIPLVREASDYVDALTGLLELGAMGQVPAGYVEGTAPHGLVPPWLTLVGGGRTYQGPLYTLIVLDLWNDGEEIKTLRPKEFYTGGELAVAISHEEIPPQGRVRVVVVKRSDVENVENAEGEVGL